MIVTGGTGGIGGACVDVLTGYGASVLACDVKEPSDTMPSGATFERLDVREAEQWDALSRHPLLSEGLDGIVNAAGVGGPGTAIADVALHDWEDIIAVNQTGTFLGTRFAVRSMIDNGRGGAIVNISSIWGDTATAGFAPYHASKGAVTAITRNTAVTYAHAGIRANCVHPGIIKTPMNDSNADEMNQALVAGTPLGRKGQPREVAQCVAFLLSDLASFVTGVKLFVDGGFHAV